MKVLRSDRFKKDYQDLDPETQTQLDKQLRLLLQNPRHPSLRVHKIKSTKGLWEFRISQGYRCVFNIEGNAYVLLQIGPHKIIDRK